MTYNDTAARAEAERRWPNDVSDLPEAEAADQ